MLATREWFVADDSGWSEASDYGAEPMGDAQAALVRAHADLLGLSASDLLPAKKSLVRDQMIVLLKKGNPDALTDAYAAVFAAATEFSPNLEAARDTAAFVAGRMFVMLSVVDTKAKFQDTTALLAQMHLALIFESHLKASGHVGPNTYEGGQYLLRELRQMPNLDQKVFNDYLVAGRGLRTVSQQFDVPQFSVIELTRKVIDTLSEKWHQHRYEKTARILGNSYD